MTDVFLQKSSTFSISHEDNILKIVNDSRFNLWVTLIPIKPKRKYTDVLVVRPGSFLIMENFNPDITAFSFRLKE